MKICSGALPWSEVLCVECGEPESGLLKGARTQPRRNPSPGIPAGHLPDASSTRDRHAEGMKSSVQIGSGGSNRMPPSACYTLVAQIGTRCNYLPELAEAITVRSLRWLCSMEDSGVAPHPRNPLVHTQKKQYWHSLVEIGRCL